MDNCKETLDPRIVAESQVLTSPTPETARGVGFIIKATSMLLAEAFGVETPRIAGDGFTMGTYRRLLAQADPVDPDQETVEVNKGRTQ